MNILSQRVIKHGKKPKALIVVEDNVDLHYHVVTDWTCIYMIVEGLLKLER